MSIGDVVDGLAGRIVLPQLLTGAWRANSAALGFIIADVELIADLATFFGRIEELQWRLRYRLEAGALTEVIDKMTAPLAYELKGEADDLLKRLQKEIDNPSVQLRGVVYNVMLSAPVATLAAIAPVRQIRITQP